MSTVRRLVHECDSCGESDAKEVTVTYDGDTIRVDLCPICSWAIRDLFHLKKQVQVAMTPGQKLSWEDYKAKLRGQ